MGFIILITTDNQIWSNSSSINQNYRGWNNKRWKSWKLTKIFKVKGFLKHDGINYLFRKINMNFLFRLIISFFVGVLSRNHLLNYHHTLIHIIRHRRKLSPPTIFLLLESFYHEHRIYTLLVIHDKLITIKTWNIAL